jgi:hypothetical protein
MVNDIVPIIVTGVAVVGIAALVVLYLNQNCDPWAVGIRNTSHLDGRSETQFCLECYPHRRVP